MEYLSESGGDAGVSEWREEAGDTGRRNCYGGENFFKKFSPP